MTCQVRSSDMTFCEVCGTYITGSWCTSNVCKDCCESGGCPKDSYCVARKNMKEKAK